MLMFVPVHRVSAETIETGARPLARTASSTRRRRQSAQPIRRATQTATPHERRPQRFAPGIARPSADALGLDAPESVRTRRAALRALVAAVGRLSCRLVETVADAEDDGSPG